MQIMTDWQLARALADIQVERRSIPELRAMVRPPAPEAEHVDTPAAFIAGVAL